MRKLFMIASILLIFVLTSCSNETNVRKESLKQSKTNEVEEETTAETNISEPKKYSFKEFRKMSDQEQQDFIIPFVNNLGYDHELAQKLLSFINDETSDIPKHFDTVNEYITYFIENSDLESNRLAEETEEGIEEEEKPLSYNGTTVKTEYIAQRIDAVKGKPFYELANQGNIALWGISIGDTLEDVTKKLGKPDVVAGWSYDNWHYYYYIPGNKLLEDDVEYFQFIFRMKNENNMGEPIRDFTLYVKGKKPTFDNIMDKFKKPTALIKSFNGDVYINNDRDHHLMFVQNEQSLDVMLGNDDFQLDAKVWDPSQSEENDERLQNTEPISIEEAARMIEDY
jgi:hypothetical protein